MTTEELRPRVDAPGRDAASASPPGAPAPDDRPTFDRDLKLAFAALVLYATGYGLFGQLVNVYALQLGAPRQMIGLLVGLGLLMTGISYLPGSWASDRYPLHRVVAAAWWLTVPATLAFALAPSWQWLAAGFALIGLSMAGNPSLKVYIMLKSPPTHVTRNISYVYAALPVGLVLGPVVGGAMADAWGMRVVFLVATVFMVASSLAVTSLRHTPYHAAGTRWHLRDLTANPRFRRHVAFFVLGFLALYLAQPFVQPYLSQVRHQGYGALGVYAAVGAMGGVLATFVAGRVAHKCGSRPALGVVLGFMLVGSILLVAGFTPAIWGMAVLLLGAFDSFRFVAAGVVSGSFGDVPPVWGYSVFDSLMGLVTFAASLLGGLLYGLAFALPFFVMIALVGALLFALAFWKGETE